MNLKATLILVALLALAVAALMLTRGGSAPSAGNDNDKNSKDNTAEARVLPEALFKKPLKQIRITPGDRPSADTLELSRDSGRWRVTYRGSAFAANNQPIDRLLATLSGLEGRIEDKAKPQTAYDWQITLVPTGQSEQAVTVVLGERLGAGRARLFIKRDGSTTAYNTSDKLHNYVMRSDPAGYYAGKLDPPLMTEAGRVEIKTPDRTEVFYHQDDHWWAGGTNPPIRVLDTTIPQQVGLDGYFQKFVQLELIRNHPISKQAGLAEFGLDQPLVRVTIHPRKTDEPTNRPTYVLRVGSIVPGSEPSVCYISYGPADDPTPPVFTASSKDALLFAQLTKNFRDPRLVTTPTRFIASLKIVGQGDAQHTLKVAIDGTAQLTDPDAKTHKVPKVLAGVVLKRLTDAVAAGFVEPGLTQRVPIAGVVVTPRGEGKPQALSIYNDPQSNPASPTVLAQRGTEPLLLRIDRLAVEALINPAVLVPKAQTTAP